MIGATPGGLLAVAAAAAFGAPVALVDDRPAGRPARDGALPLAALCAAASRADAIRGAGRFGLGASFDAVVFDGVRRRVRDTVADVAANDSAARFEAMGVRVVRAAARFLDDARIEAGGATIRARRFVVAIGASPAIPAIPGLETTPYFTSETILDLAETPARLIVVGAGATGLALAQAFARLGAEATVLDAGRALRREDPEMARIALDRLARDGVVVRQETGIRLVCGAAGDISVALAGGETLRGTHLLLAAGRRPALDGLNLDKAGVSNGDAGIVVGRDLRTSSRRIYAIGDCVAGQPRSAHAALHQAGLVARAILFRSPGRADPQAIPRLTLTDPEIASCGLSEAEARATHSGVMTLRWPFAENDRARAERAVEGHVKLVATRRGRILGVAIVGRRAGELLPVWSLAIAKRLKVSDIAGVPFACPTLSDASKRAAMSFLAPSTQNPVLRRAVALLRRFG